MSERLLPEGWVGTTLGQVVTKPQYGYTTKASHHGAVKFLRTTDITKGRLSWDTVPFCHEAPDDIEKFRLYKGDVVVSRAGSVGFSYLVEDVSEDAVFASYLIRFRPLGDLGSRFVKRYLQSPFYWSQLKDRAAGNALQNVNAKKLTTLRIDIPPLEEQKIIADKLDDLLAQVGNLKARLDAIPGILKKFRQSVLAAAVNGKLTARWREQSKALFPYPNKLLGDIIIEMRNGLSPKPNQHEVGYPILRISSVRPFGIDQRDIRYLDVSNKERERYSLATGDLVFTRYNGSSEFVGVCGRVNDISHETLLYPDKLIRVRVDEAQVYSRYLEIFAASHLARSYVQSLIKSTSGQKGISGKDLKEMEVALPCHDEQAEIVCRVDQLFALADQVEKQVKNAQARVDKLTQSILAKAFRGELTAEWRAANPELISGENSAEALLERIKAEKAKQKPAGKGRGRKSVQPSLSV